MIHKLAEVYSNHIGVGTKIWQFSIVLEGALIGNDCNINCFTLIEGKARIGNRVTIKPGVFIWDGVTIEDDVMVGPNVTFTNDKWPKSKNTNFSLLPTLIRKGASLGANSTILCGITIGKFALIASGALVTKNVPDRALVMGVPALIKGWMNEDGSKMKKENEFYIDNQGNHWQEVDGEIIKL